MRNSCVEVLLLMVQKSCTSLIGSLSHYLHLFTGIYTSQVVQDFFHQQYVDLGCFATLREYESYEAQIYDLQVNARSEGKEKKNSKKQQHLGWMYFHLFHSFPFICSFPSKIFDFFGLFGLRQKKHVLFEAEASQKLIWRLCVYSGEDLPRDTMCPRSVSQNHPTSSNERYECKVRLRISTTSQDNQIQGF